MDFDKNKELINIIESENLDTPCYIFSDKILYEKIAEIKRELTECNALCFAMKANPFLINSLKDSVERFEVCSPGEYEICYKQGINPNKIIVSGVNKTYESIDRILTISQGKGIYTIESPLHYKILSELAKEKGFKLNIIIRLSSGNQFGVDKITFEALLDKVLNDEHCSFIGIHYFSGTQKKIKKIQKELVFLNEYAFDIKSKFNLKDLELEYGPGLSVSYFKDENIPTSQEQLKELNLALKEMSNFSRIGIELGRFIAADCGFFKSKVIDIKETKGSKYVIIDGGIHQLHYFGQMMGMKHPYIFQSKLKNREKIEKYIICGSLCSVNDVIVRDAELNKLDIGDNLIFSICGAYSMTESSSLFLSRELPAVYNLMNDDKIMCFRKLSDTYIYNTLK